MKKIITAILLAFSLNSISQTQLSSPLDIPLILSANFGELRPNHFHSGIDLKTQGVINKAVYSVEDGYISRISVSPYGYGLALYVSHPNGLTSVYGHLNKFAPQIAEYIKNRQYELESYRIDLTLEPNIFPVKKGDFIAYSGNTGSSGGPHVHFELRETESQKVIDPLIYYKNNIKDTQVPLIKGISIYPSLGKGVVNGSSQPSRQTVSPLKNKTYSNFKSPIKAWGNIGVAISAIDKMNGTTNIYGIKKLKLYCDDQEVFAYDIQSINFSTSRMINSFIDYDYWSKTKVFYMKSFIAPGNKLESLSAKDNGYITIDKEKIYSLRYELEDFYGNKTVYSFRIEGVKQTIPTLPKCSQVMAWDYNNHYITDSFSLIIPKENLYEDLCFRLKQSKGANFFSDIYQVHDSYVPLDKNCLMKIKLTNDTISNKLQYGVVRIKNSKEYWIGGAYNNGYMDISIRDLGHSFVISTDTVAPKIEPLMPEKWSEAGEIKIKVTDNKSGVNSYKGTIDGQFALFEHDMKSTIYKYKLDPLKLSKNSVHKLTFNTSDGCGNTSNYEYEFKY